MSQSLNLNNSTSRIPLPRFSDLSYADQLYQISLARSERESYKANEETKKKSTKKKSGSTKKSSGAKKQTAKVNQASKLLAGMSQEQIDALLNSKGE